MESSGRKSANSRHSDFSPSQRVPFSNQSSAAWRQTMLETGSSQNLAERSKASSEHWQVRTLQYVVPDPKWGSSAAQGLRPNQGCVIIWHPSVFLQVVGLRLRSFGSAMEAAMALHPPQVGFGDLDPASAQCHGPKGQSSPVMAANDLHVSKLSQAQRSREIPQADCSWLYVGTCPCQNTKKSPSSTAGVQ